MGNNVDKVTLTHSHFFKKGKYLYNFEDFHNYKVYRSSTIDKVYRMKKIDMSRSQLKLGPSIIL